MSSKKNNKQKNHLNEKEVADIIEKKVEKQKYTIVSASETFFIIKKDGFNVKIKKINNYKKGDKIVL